MMAHAADRLVAWPAGKHVHRFNKRGNRVERRPVPGAGWAKNSDRRSAQCCSDVQKPRVVGHRSACGCERQDSLAQIGSGEVTDVRGRGSAYIGSDVLLAWPTQDPDVVTFGDEAAC